MISSIQYGRFFKVDSLSTSIALMMGIFFILTALYSFKYMRGKQGLPRYYGSLLVTFLASLGVLCANNLIILAVCWGFLGLPLYLLIAMGGEKANAAAKKAFIIVGGSDALMLFGIAVYYSLTRTFQMDFVPVPLHESVACHCPGEPVLSPHLYFLAALSYACFALASFAKAGAMPLHTWIPDCAERAPAPVSAFLPASLDKLLGIYLLARISLRIFVLPEAAHLILMLIGALTIICAVMMALVQHNMKRLLGYHAVSQVGYMVLGLGTGNPFGIAGGLFHMFNHTVYKSCLFLTAGNVERASGTTDLDKLGGLAKAMPLTFISCLVASLSISGVPPFNGFFSKRMIYQGLIEQLRSGSFWLQITSLVCLAAAMFGSALTLASFMKLLHAAFLGPRLRESAPPREKEVSWQMWLPCVLLAVVCFVFGVFAYQIPLKYLVLPSVPRIAFLGLWDAWLPTMLMAAAWGLGIAIMKTRLKETRRDAAEAFIGGEQMDPGHDMVTGTDFYNTVRDFYFLGRIYRAAEKGFFDLYEAGKAAVFGVGRVFQYLHNGVLPTYLVWMLLGMTGLLLVLAR
jgi:formate hydrogenlyase subunit 3/multisubunit Na+/H+ antiporter MnhD subunit